MWGALQSHPFVGWCEYYFPRVAYRREEQVVSARSSSILHCSAILRKAKVLQTIDGSSCWRFVAKKNLAFRNWQKTKRIIDFVVHLSMKSRCMKASRLLGSKFLVWCEVPRIAISSQGEVNNGTYSFHLVALELFVLIFGRAFLRLVIVICSRGRGVVAAYMKVSSFSSRVLLQDV